MNKKGRVADVVVGTIDNRRAFFSVKSEQLKSGEYSGRDYTVFPNGEVVLETLRGANVKLICSVIIPSEILAEVVELEEIKSKIESLLKKKRKELEVDLNFDNIIWLHEEYILPRKFFKNDATERR